MMADTSLFKFWNGRNSNYPPAQEIRTHVGIFLKSVPSLVQRLRQVACVALFGTVFDPEAEERFGNLDLSAAKKRRQADNEETDTDSDGEKIQKTSRGGKGAIATKRAASAQKNSAKAAKRTSSKSSKSRAPSSKKTVEGVKLVIKRKRTSTGSNSGGGPKKAKSAKKQAVQSQAALAVSVGAASTEQDTTASPTSVGLHHAESSEAPSL